MNAWHVAVVLAQQSFIEVLVNALQSGAQSLGRRSALPQEMNTSRIRNSKSRTGKIPIKIDCAG
ncbi:hypothetical protein SV7mr_45930 [Stieleria bergensis]|uniref:Uncharacterized protein n=1 Tax=Stieleria bergensis TaxID=2528025 RepID=A0A517T105_9BACT|nr:hypothetical protein SV7mr_45930 [Planctomycetes bacterium SV_7m_r]